MMIMRETVIMKKRASDISLNKYQVLPKCTLCYKTVKSFFYAHSIGKHDKLHFELGIGSVLSET